MIGYVTVGTNDLGRAVNFYGALLGELGARKLWSTDRMTMFGVGQGQPTLAVCTPFDGKTASAGNGTMVALAAPSREVVQRLHAKALALGGSDEGAPGDRGNGFFGAYFRDPDGNKFVAFKMG
jgi:catechol 2,3-dioxygenase-like lactoylglutathione lyase family enzyme